MGGVTPVVAAQLGEVMAGRWSVTACMAAGRHEKTPGAGAAGGLLEPVLKGGLVRLQHQRIRRLAAVGDQGIAADHAVVDPRFGQGVQGA